MRIANEEHQAFLLHLLTMDGLNVPAPMIDLYLEVREAVKAACVGCSCACGKKDDGEPS